MKQYATDKLRNVALVAHGGAGKTSLAEALLFRSGATKRLGSVDEGTSILDYDSEEIKRKISISASVAPVEWKDRKINILDTPGYFDFAGEVIGSLNIADGCVVLACATNGVEVGTEKVWTYADNFGLARMIFINKLDRENADFFKVLSQLQEMYGQQVIPIQLPIGQAESFQGLVDLVKMKALLYKDGKVEETEIPAEMQDDVATYREALVEAVAVTDDELAMKYLEGETLSQEELEKALGEGTKTRQLIPVLCGSALMGAGIDTLMDYCIHCLPAPSEAGEVEGIDPSSEKKITRRQSADEPLTALVYKTMADPYVGRLTLFRVYSGVLKSDSQVHNSTRGIDERIGQVFLIRGKEQIPVDSVAAGDLAAVAKLQETTTGDTLCAKGGLVKLAPIEFPEPSLTMAVQPKSKGDEEKIASGLARLQEEDPTFTVTRVTETAQTVVSGMGDMHLEIIASRLANKFGVEVELSLPRIPYKETIKGKADVEGRHKKQSGGRGQYGHVFLRMEPLAPGDGFEFVDEIFGGSVPRQYIPAVEKGIQETLVEGVLAGYPVVDVRVTLYDGSYHSVDSSEMAFKIAASMAFKKGFMDAQPILLEPIMNVEVTVPEAYMGDIIGDLNKKRGRILGMDPKNGHQIIKAQVPQAELFRYATDLRSITQGRGSFTMAFDHYEEVPANIAEQVIAASREETA
ncbi:MAG: elongation factor G [Firmicutes bacterium]|nr:elongation factor G [Bacillota bacterium]